VQDHVEAALSAFADQPVATVCAGRTDAGVHAVNQVVHVDAPVERDPFSWVRGTNRYLPADIAVQWCQPVGPTSTPATARADGATLPCCWSRRCGRRWSRAGGLGVPAAGCRRDARPRPA
jgi:hypothetical protein